MSTSTQTSCYVMVILGWGWVGWGGAMTFMSTCPHTSCYVIVMFSCTCTHTHVMLRYGDLLLHLLTHVMLRYGYLGTIDTLPISRRTLQGRQSNEALLRRRKKVLHPKKTRTYVKKRSSFGDFQNPIFHVNMIKIYVSL